MLQEEVSSWTHLSLPRRCTPQSLIAAAGDPGCEGPSVALEPAAQGRCPLAQPLCDAPLVLERREPVPRGGEWGPPTGAGAVIEARGQGACGLFFLKHFSFPFYLCRKFWFL